MTTRTFPDVAQWKNKFGTDDSRGGFSEHQNTKQHQKRWQYGHQQKLNKLEEKENQCVYFILIDVNVN